jgi:hypothetical protein
VSNRVHPWFFFGWVGISSNSCLNRIMNSKSLVNNDKGRAQIAASPTTSPRSAGSLVRAFRPTANSRGQGCPRSAWLRLCRAVYSLSPRPLSSVALAEEDAGREPEREFPEKVRALDPGTLEMRSPSGSFSPPAGRRLGRGAPSLAGSWGGAPFSTNSAPPRIGARNNPNHLSINHLQS